MAKTARAAIEDLLTCESCHAFYYVERAEDGARTRLRCTSCGHSRDVLLSGAKTNKWTIIDPNGEVKTFTEWEDLVRSMGGSVVTAVRAKLPSDNPVSDRAMSERPPAAAKAASEPAGPSAQTEEEEKPKSMSGAALLDVTPTPMAPALSLEDSAPVIAPSESDKSIEISLSEPKLPAVAEAKPEALVEALVSAMPEASAPPAPAVEKSADVAPVAAKSQEPWDDDEAEVLSMRDIQVVPVSDSNPDEVEIREKDSESRASTAPQPPARGALRTLPPARPGAPPPPTITFDEAKKSDPPPAVKKDSAPPPKAKEDAKSEPPKKADEKKKTDEKKTDVAAKAKDTDKAKEKDKEKPKDDSRVANTVPPKRGTSAAKPVATAKAQVGKPEEGGRSWLLPALGVAAAAGVVWYIANGSGGAPAPTNNPTAAPTTTAAPTNTTASTEKPDETEPTTTTATATAMTSASAAPPSEKAATPTVKPADTAAKPANPTPDNGTAAAAKPVSNANLSMAEALDKAGKAKRGGDYGLAKELYARVLKDSPANVEAHSGLGDIARAQGDLAAAKASYQKALAASPDYGPALLNLADTEWDLGDRAAAQSRYQKIVAARGGSAPQRAKDRAGTE